jgi:hypothetical protein
MRHNRYCLAAAMKAAIENFRDSISVSPADFVEFAQRDILTTAEGYLADGTMSCTCNPS